MSLIKIFSGSEILAIALQQKIEAEGVNTILKDNIQSAKLSGFGSSDLAVELFIQQADHKKVLNVIEDFRLNL
jgi:hypothetical protein